MVHLPILLYLVTFSFNTWSKAYKFSVNPAHGEKASWVLKTDDKKFSLNEAPISELFIPKLKTDILIIVQDYKKAKNENASKCAQGRFELKVDKKLRESGCLNSLRFRSLRKAFSRLEKYTSFVNPKLSP